MSDRAKGVERHLDLVSMGCRWVLDVSELDDAAAAETTQRWQRCVELASVATPVIEDDPQMLTVSATAKAYDLSRELTRKGLMRLRGQVTLLHAAALADPDGRALVLVAPSGGGKSTATRVLGQRLGYVSDETVVLLDDHRIAPHPKPPSLVIDPQDRSRKNEPPPDELGLGPTPGSPRLGRLVTLAREDSVTEPAIEEVGLIDQLLAILPETSSTWLVPGGLDRLARAASAGGPPARLHYAEIDTCHDLVRSHLAAPAAPAPEWEHLPPDEARRQTGEHPDLATADDDGLAGDELAGDLRLTRAPWSDAVAQDGEVLVLAGSRPLRLAGAGAVIWRAADAPATVDALVAAVVDALGDHPDAGALVRAAAADLLHHGALALA